LRPDALYRAGGPNLGLHVPPGPFYPERSRRAAQHLRLDLRTRRPPGGSASLQAREKSRNNSGLQPRSRSAAIVFAAIFAAKESLFRLALVAAAFPRRSRPDGLYREGGPNLDLDVPPGSFHPERSRRVARHLRGFGGHTRSRRHSEAVILAAEESLFGVAFALPAGVTYELRTNCFGQFLSLNAFVNQRYKTLL
jgi:hypothetical protein